MPRRRPPVLPQHRLRSRLAGWLRWVAEALEPAPPGLDLTGAPEFWAERVRAANRQARAHRRAPWVLAWRRGTRPVRDNSQFGGHGDTSQTRHGTQSASQQTTAVPGREAQPAQHRRSMPGIAVPPGDERDTDRRSEAGRRRHLGVPLVRPRSTARPGPTGDERRNAAPVTTRAARPPDESQTRNATPLLRPQPAARPGPPGDERRQAAPVTTRAARPPDESQTRNATPLLRPQPAARPGPPGDERLREPTSHQLAHLPAPAVLPGTLWPELPVRPAVVPSRPDSTLALLRYQRLAAEQAAT